MIPTGLQDIFGTLSVGLLCVAAFTGLFWVGSNSEMKFRDWYQSLWFKPNKEGFVLPLVFFFGIYAIGLIGQYLTDHLTDSERSSTPVWPAGPIKLHEESYHRISALFSEFEYPKNGGACLELSGLGREVFSRDLWRERIPTSVGNKKISERLYLSLSEKPQVASKACSKGTYFDIDKEGLVAVVNSYYYMAKNWSYSQNTYFDELQGIQRSLDFLRSGMLVAAWALILVPLSLLVSLWRWRPSGNLAESLEQAKFAFRRVAMRAFVLSFCLYSISYSAHLGWERAEISFNERALGYFSTAIDLNIEGLRDELQHD